MAVKLSKAQNRSWLVSGRCSDLKRKTVTSGNAVYADYSVFNISQTEGTDPSKILSTEGFDYNSNPMAASEFIGPTAQRLNLILIQIVLYEFLYVVKKNTIVNH